MNNETAKKGFFVFILCVLFLAGCQEGMTIPDGDAAAGRHAFEGFLCYTCHRVSGDEFPAPTAEPPVPVVLGKGSNLDRPYLFESILAPSHRFAKPRQSEISADPGMPISKAEYKNIKEGTKSRMGDFREVMTVKELLDLVAYLESLQKK